jgi:hypothetical protein
VDDRIFANGFEAGDATVQTVDRAE